MRVAFISLGSPLDRASWSGIPWYSYQEVKRRYPDTHVIDSPIVDRMMRRTSPMQRMGILVSRQPLLARWFSRFINNLLETIRPDVVVVVGAAHKIAHLDHKWPLVYVSDAMFMTIVTYYRRYFHLSDKAIRVGDELQRAMLQRADAVLLASEWATQSAAEHYGLVESRLKVVPMGANLDADPGFAAPRVAGPMKLLFIGYDWRRKGGDQVLAVWKELRRLTGDAELHIVGCLPQEATGLDGVHLHGVLRKSVPADYERLIALYAEASFFFMPSRQEAFGIVYCEAAAFGRPSVAAATGGVASAVSDGVTGILLPEDASVADYVVRILAVWNDRPGYVAMCEAARKSYLERLSWQAWGAALAATIEEVVGKRKQGL